MFRTLAALSLFAMSAQAVEVRDARLMSGPGSSRVILDLSGKAEHRFSRLTNPERLVLDIHGVRVPNKSRVALAPSGAVKGVRLGQRGRNDLRVKTVTMVFGSTWRTSLSASCCLAAASADGRKRGYMKM